jgi:tetratricopeptide (TPR) repeat protein
LGSILLLRISAHASVFTYYYDFNGAGRQKGFGITANMPNCAVDFIARHQLTGHAFVSYPFASLLIYRMHPVVKVNMDSRNDVYGEELFREYLEALGSPDAMRGYLERHRIDFFLVAYSDRVPAVFDYLQSTGEWAPVHYDDRAFILVKHGPETEDLIRRENFRFIRPAVEAPMTVEASNAGQVLQEAERAIRNCPTALFAYYYKAKALLLLERYEEAIATTRQILARDPANVTLYADMGQAFLRLGQQERAIEMYEKALKISPEFAPVREKLQAILGLDE